MTPLFLVLLDEYERWTGDLRVGQRGSSRRARAAMALDRCDPPTAIGDGYIEYQTRNPSRPGLVNQCWKDSQNSIAVRGRPLAAQPRATCEIQGYAYDARVRIAPAGA